MKMLASKLKRLSVIMIVLIVSATMCASAYAVTTRGYIGIAKREGTYYGISADIKTPFGLPTLTGTPAVAAWVSSLEMGSTSSNAEFIQTGFHYNPNEGDTTWTTYVESKKNGVHHLQSIGTQPLDTTINYCVRYTNYDDKWHASIGGINKYSLAMDYEQQVQANTECIKHYSTDTIVLPAITFLDVKYLTNSGIWYLNTLAPVTADAPYHFTIYNYYYKFSCHT